MRRVLQDPPREGNRKGFRPPTATASPVSPATAESPPCRRSGPARWPGPSSAAYWRRRPDRCASRRDTRCSSGTLSSIWARKAMPFSSVSVHFARVHSASGYMISCTKLDLPRLFEEAQARVPVFPRAHGRRRNVAGEHLLAGRADVIFEADRRVDRRAEAPERPSRGNPCRAPR